jgi:hypothetical protein
MNTSETRVFNRPAMVNTLAVVGFVALVGASMWLAVYSTRYIPTVVGRLGAAAVYLGSVFNTAEGPSLSVIPTASTTIPFGNGTTTEPVDTTPTSPKPVTPTAGDRTSGTYPINGTPATSPVLSGLPDFVVSIDTLGYLATASTDSFVASSTVPSGSRPAVKFSIKNIGSNVAGAWRFSASIPTQTSYIFQSPTQQPLNPGDSIDYILGFDQANKGADQMISITANFDRAVSESNANNNSASAKITILGS